MCSCCMAFDALKLRVENKISRKYCEDGVLSQGIGSTAFIRKGNWWEIHGSECCTQRSVRVLAPSRTIQCVPRVQQPEHEANHSASGVFKCYLATLSVPVIISAMVKNMWSCIFTLQYLFMLLCSGTSITVFVKFLTNCNCCQLKSVKVVHQGKAFYRRHDK